MSEEYQKAFYNKLNGSEIIKHLELISKLMYKRREQERKESKIMMMMMFIICLSDQRESNVCQRYERKSP